MQKSGYMIYLPTQKGIKIGHPYPPPGLPGSCALQNQVKISDQALLLREITKGAKRRTTESNGINETSSRSHAIIAVSLQYTNTNGSTVSAKLLLVDLAGNEHTYAAEKGFTPVPKHQSRHIPSTAPVKDITRAQGRGINVGLFHLHQLIKALARGKQPTSNLFKSSKLTELLEPALGGRKNGIMSKGCRTLMVGCISPAAVDAKQSMRTLHFIEAAGAVKIKVAADIMLSTSRQAEVDLLRQQLKHAEEEVEKVRQEKEQLQEKDLEKVRQAELHADEIQELKAQIDAMQATFKTLRASENSSLQPPPPTELDFADDTDTASPFPDMYMDDITSKKADDVIDLTNEEPDSDKNTSKAALGERTPGYENTPSSQVPMATPPPMSRQKTSTPQSKSTTKRRLQPPGVSRFGTIEGVVLSSCKKRQKKIPPEMREYLERYPHWRAGQQLLSQGKVIARK